MKLFFLPGAKEDVETRARYAKEALEAVAEALGVTKFDTLILSLPNIVLEKDEDDYISKEFPVPAKTRQSWVDTWKVSWAGKNAANDRYSSHCITVGKYPPLASRNSGYSVYKRCYLTSVFLQQLIKST